MKKTLEVGIIGLGKFGRQLGIVLTELGHNVLGVDIDPQRVHAVQDIFPQTYVADATDKTALDQLKLQSCDTVAVSVGSTMDSSILITFCRKSKYPFTLPIHILLLSLSQLIHFKHKIFSSPLLLFFCL